ncbi:NAD-dependent epimerase/dehydratase family protein [Pedobacter hartonius]|uniref:Nucleoside-diphosphate-sugar epimerase n=1 Tax=Pedobacter hartonius TaxID=425514 RepID=A0A1H4CSN6_9SPHI|nr:NAD-dependent epimerase/dehydratase family protein [Pedobacter hartonius]SEA63415.1 Nucleoside-diphosphate-sugar epimerase [Pedobacter hartonius]
MKKVFITGGSGFVGQSLIPLLVEKGYLVSALARSQSAIDKVEKLGAVAIEGDVNNTEAITKGVKNAETVFHLAGYVDFFASEKELYDLHVKGTDLVLRESQKAGVTNFVYLGAASVIMNGRPIKNADEGFISDHLIDGYSKTKLAAEKLVLEANASSFRTISIRPPLIWGKGDPNLPEIMEAIRKGQMQFIGDGLHKIVTGNVKNVCEALLLAEQRGTGGEFYFITDGEQVVFKDFIRKYLATQGVAVPDKFVSIGTAKFIAGVMEFFWKIFRLKGHPPLYRAMINILGIEFITSDAKARKDLGYKSFVTVEQGLAVMRSPEI